VRHLWVIVWTFVGASVRADAMEIITGVERRRRLRPEEKLRIVTEAEQPGACFAEVARRHDVSRALLWTWRRQVREGRRRSRGADAFLPVQVVAEAPSAGGIVVSCEPGVGRSRRSPRPAGAEAGLIEIALADGTMVRVGRDVGATALRRVLGVLRG
jgi:transposase